ncbi:uncharacterized protein LOC115510205 [Lynx canadensis]|uniref:uncharacterized protein LOC115510205 n=1 Tax=Lynx canadensis TaxID=61383 RepID=UPI0013C4D34D|nr:uncharacterized protein LOC115510205 [Lynx canadensis]
MNTAAITPAFHTCQRTLPTTSGHGCHDVRFADEELTMEHQGGRITAADPPRSGRLSGPQSLDACDGCSSRPAQHQGCSNEASVRCWMGKSFADGKLAPLGRFIAMTRPLEIKDSGRSLLPSALCQVSQPVQSPKGQQGPKERKSVPVLCSLLTPGLLEWPPAAPGPCMLTEEVMVRIQASTQQIYRRPRAGHWGPKPTPTLAELNPGGRSDQLHTRVNKRNVER